MMEKKENGMKEEEEEEKEKEKMIHHKFILSCSNSSTLHSTLLLYPIIYSNTLLSAVVFNSQLSFICI